MFVCLAHEIIYKNMGSTLWAWLQQVWLMDERELKKVLQGRDVLAVIERALENGDLKPCQRIGRDGFTLLHWSCYYGQTEVMC